jgi:hypothetical protein
MCPPKVPKNAQSRVTADYYWETFEVPIGSPQAQRRSPSWQARIDAFTTARRGEGHPAAVRRLL